MDYTISQGHTFVLILAFDDSPIATTSCRTGRRRPAYADRDDRIRRSEEDVGSWGGRLVALL